VIYGRAYVPTLTVEIDAGPDADATQLLRLTTQLRRQLLELDVEAVEAPAIDAPQGAKTVDQTVAGMLLVTLTPVLVRATLDIIRAWLATSQARSAKVELDGDAIELTGLSATDQNRLITGFLERHNKKP
jgi:hypothetical protein